MNRIELKINDDKSMEVVTPQPLVEGENLTTEIGVEIPASWVGSAIRALITTPKGVLVDAVDASVPVGLTNTMLSGRGTLYVEYVAMKDGTEIARTKSPALLPVSAARSIIGDIDPAPLPDLVAEMVAAKGDCDSAADACAETDAEIKAAEAARVTAEGGRVSAESARVIAENSRATVYQEVADARGGQTNLDTRLGGLDAQLAQKTSYDRTEFMTIRKNLVDPSKAVVGSRMASNGAIASDATRYRTDYLPVTPGKKIALTAENVSAALTHTMYFVVAFDASKTFISGVSTVTTYTVPSGCAFIVVTGASAYAINIIITATDDGLAPTYEPYMEVPKYLDEVDNTSDASKPISTATQTAINAIRRFSPDWVPGGISATTGAYSTTNNYIRSPMFYFGAGDTIVNSNKTLYRLTVVKFSLVDKTFLSGQSGIATGVTNSTACYAVVVVNETPIADISGRIATVAGNISILLSTHAVAEQNVLNGAVTWDKLDDYTQTEILDYNPVKTEYINDEIERIKAATLASDGVLNFIFSTDQHLTRYLDTLYKVQEVARVANLGQFDFVVLGGDLATGESWFPAQSIIQTKQATIGVIEAASRAVTDVPCPVFFLQGNHDTNFAGWNGATDYNTANDYTEGDPEYIDPSTDTIRPHEWFRLTNNRLGETVVWDADNPKGGYFYKDFHRSKIRTICLSTCDVFDADGGTYMTPNYPFVQQAQFDWFCNVALDFSDKSDKADWAVIVISHADAFYASAGGLHFTQCHNFQGVLNAFLTGGTYAETTNTGEPYQLVSNVNYTTQGAMEFICSINGHLHGDMAVDIPLLSVSRPTITTANASTEQKDYSGSTYITSPSRATNDITSELFDIYSIDRTARKIRTIRFGAGEDREISY